MIAADEFTAQLDVVARDERPVGPDAPARSAGRFEDDDVRPAVNQGVGAREPGEARADDDHRRRASDPAAAEVVPTGPVAVAGATGEMPQRRRQQRRRHALYAQPEHVSAGIASLAIAKVTVSIAARESGLGRQAAAGAVPQEGAECFRHALPASSL